MEVILNETVLLLVEATLKVVADKLKVATAASCVTVIVCGVNPDAVTVTMAVRVLANGFDVAVNVMLPLFEPFTLLTLNHA